jgi:hypothetical protein
MTVAPRRAAAAEADPTVVMTRPPAGVPAGRTRVDAPVPQASGDDEVTLPPPMPPPRPTPPPPKLAPPPVVVQQAAPTSRMGLWVAWLGASIALGAGGAYLWAARSSGPVEPPASAASEPSTGSPVAVRPPVVVPAPAPAPAPVAVAAPAPAPLPPPVVETSTATVNTPATNLPPPRPAGNAGPLTDTVTAAASAAAAKPKPRDLLGRPGTRPDGALVPLPLEQRAAERPVPRPEESPPNYPTSANVRPLPSLPSPAAPVRQGPSNPREACGSRVFLALALCMEEQCEKPGFKSHPQCDTVRQMVERRRRGEN